MLIMLATVTLIVPLVLWPAPALRTLAGLSVRLLPRHSGTEAALSMRLAVLLALPRIDSYRAVATLRAQDRALLVGRVDVRVLDRLSSGQLLGEGALMPVTPPSHLSDQGLVPEIERIEFPTPPARLRVLGITAFVLGENPPEGVKFPVLAEQMPPAEFGRR
jgi:hypothetical protein